MSSCSLFEVEVAEPLKKVTHFDNLEDDIEDKLKREILEMMTDSNQDHNFAERKGRVFTYSMQGGLAQNKEVKSKNEVHYRLRHLNTGKLVID